MGVLTAMARYKVFKPSFQELEADRFSHVSISNKYLHAFDEAPLLIPGNDVEETPLFNLQANLIPNGLLLSVMCHAPVLNQLWMSYILHSLFGQTDVQSIAAQNDTTFFVEDIEAQLEENVESAGKPIFHLANSTLALINLDRHRNAPRTVPGVHPCH